MFIKPTWPAPKSVQAFTTIRSGGISQAPYHQFNLATHVGDNPEYVLTNRMLLKNNLTLPNEPIWLQQTHSTIALPALPENRHQEADATFSNQSNQVCVVLTADCLPILLCNQEGTLVAAIHAGWKGLLNGIIEATLDQIQGSHQWLAWLGPAISSKHYEVGNEVRDQFLAQHPDHDIGFSPSPNQRWLADLYLLARLRLQKRGISSIYGGEFCTFSNSGQFYSYRRDGQATGRMATLIWIDSNINSISSFLF